MIQSSLAAEIFSSEQHFIGAGRRDARIGGERAATFKKSDDTDTR